MKIKNLQNTGKVEEKINDSAQVLADLLVEKDKKIEEVDQNR